MAKQVEGYMGGFSGKLGPAIGYCWRGRWCLRTAPRTVKNPRTAVQQSHRMAFKQMVQLSSSMHDALRIGMRAESLEMGMTECNLFARLNKDFVFEDRIDFDMLRVSCGPVAPVGFGTPVLDRNNVLTINYERNPLHIHADNTDNVYLYVHCPEAGSGLLSAPSTRGSRRIAMALPDEWTGRAIHIYGFVIDYRGWASESVYLSMDEAVLEEEGIMNYSSSSPKLGEHLNGEALLSSSSPKLGEGDRRAAVVEECVGAATEPPENARSGSVDVPHTPGGVPAGQGGVSV